MAESVRNHILVLANKRSNVQRVNDHGVRLGRPPAFFSSRL